MPRFAAEVVFPAHAYVTVGFSGISFLVSFVFLIMIQPTLPVVATAGGSTLNFLDLDVSPFLFLFSLRALLTDGSLFISIEVSCGLLTFLFVASCQTSAFGCSGFPRKSSEGFKEKKCLPGVGQLVQDKKRSADEPDAQSREEQEGGQEICQ